MNNIIYTTRLGGHRSLYANALLEFEEFKLIVSKPNIKLLMTLSLKPKNLIFLTIDDSFYYYIICSIVRMLQKKKTIGIMLEPLGFLKNKSFKNKLKIIILNIFKKLGFTVIINIYSGLHLVDCENFYSGDIYDPAFWDLDVGKTKLLNSNDNSNVNLNDIFEIGYIYILFLGSISKRKRFDLFAECCKQNTNKKIKFIAAGDSSESFDKSIIIDYKKNGGILIDRYITDSEVILLQSKSNIYWAFYAKDFDQSSGIAGRAYQYDKKLITRNESLINYILANLNYNVLSFDESELIQLFKFNKFFEVAKRLNNLNYKKEDLKTLSFSEIKRLINY